MLPGWEEHFSDVEQLLEDHHQEGSDIPADADTFQEAEVAEVLAATWKERRQELNRPTVRQGQGGQEIFSGGG